MSGDEPLRGRWTRECVALLAESDAPAGVANREKILLLMGAAWVAGRQSALSEWGESLDRLHGAFAEASE